MRSAFTLVEMVVVIAIIVVLVTIVLPAVSALWGAQQAAQVENQLKGILMTARADALRADGVETGFFAYVDGEGVQRLVPIERAHAEAAVFQQEDCVPDADAVRAQLRDPLRQIGWQNVFVIREKPDEVLPTPIRAVPRYVVNEESPSATAGAFSPEELTNNDFLNPPGDKTQRHRNFFAVVFSTDGRLEIGRDVLILDCNTNADEDAVGDRTGLPVGEAVEQYFAADGRAVPVDPTGTVGAIPNLISVGGSDSIAVNFPSVDGLLVYDDQLFNELPGGSAVDLEAKRAFLLREARPLYISRYTATIVRGSRQEATE